MYRQMGGLLDDLKLHERALDLLIELLKKEQVYIYNYICMYALFPRL